MGSVPHISLIFKMLSPARASGVGKTSTPSPWSTKDVVFRDCLSWGVNRLGMPRTANRRSTSSGEREIMCGNDHIAMIIFKLVRIPTQHALFETV